MTDKGNMASEARTSRKGSWKNMKKIGAIAIALLMIMLCATAWATSPADLAADGVAGDFSQPDAPSGQGNAVILYKEITAYNKDASKVNAPVLTYHYAIEPGSEGKSVKDAGTAALHDGGEPVSAQTKAGLEGATISGSADGGTTYTEGELNLTNAVKLTTADNGAANKFKIKVDFSAVNWTGAGVYRYKITESTASGAKAAAGITDGGIPETLYMDVYVMDKTGGGYEVYGYVCFKENNDIDGTSTDSLKAVQKTEGFVTGDTDGNGKTDPDEEADKYYTFNLEISKTLTGDQAMNSHKFPFSVTFTNATVTANILLGQETTTGGGITATAPAAAGVSSLSVTNLALANGAKVKYIGIPVGVTAATTVAVYETNDVTGTFYQSGYAVDGTAGGRKVIGWTNADNRSNTATLSTVTANADDDTSHTIAFTNVLQQISPTGYVTRYAPYGLILIAGIALLVIARKHRKNSDEE